MNLNSDTLDIEIIAGEKINVVIKAGGIIDHFYGYGSKDLTLLSTKDIVFRKSGYTCDRTILVKCSKSSSDLNRNLIKKITSSNEQISIFFKDYEKQA